MPRQPVRHIHEPQNNYANAEEYASNANKKSITKERNAKGHRVECSNWFSVCNESSSGRQYPKLHEAVHNGQYRYSCDVCRKQFMSLSDWKVHQHVHSGERPFSCGVCFKSFIQRTHLQAHLHTHSGERPFSCDVCRKAFVSPSHLKVHETC